MDMNRKKAIECIYRSIKDNKMKEIGEFIECITNINELYMYNSTLLHYASQFGNVDAVEYLLGRGACIEIKNSYEERALHLAAENGKSDVVKLLLEHGAKIEMIDKNCWTALHYAANGGHSSIVKILIDNGADINAKDYCGRTPLRLAELSGSMSNVKSAEILKRADIRLDDHIVKKAKKTGPEMKTRSDTGEVPNDGKPADLILKPY